MSKFDDNSAAAIERAAARCHKRQRDERMWLRERHTIMGYTAFVAPAACTECNGTGIYSDYPVVNEPCEACGGHGRQVIS